MANPVEAVRVGLGDAVRRLLAGDGAAEVARAPADRDDGGLFGPDSVTWVVHSDLATLVGGLRALFVQTLHPLAMAGVAEHSAYRTEPLGRLHRTGAFVGATTFGTTEQAEVAIATVRGVHRRVQGVAPDGRRYAATDPHLLRWVHVTEVDSFLRAYQRYGTSKLSRADQDRYVAEMAVVARKLGADRVPEDVTALATSLKEFRPELIVGAQARETIRFLLVPPAVPMISRGPYAVVTAAAVSLLPGWARRAMLLPVAPLSEPLAVRPATTALLRTLGWALGTHPAVAA